MLGEECQPLAITHREKLGERSSQKPIVENLDSGITDPTIWGVGGTTHREQNTGTSKRQEKRDWPSFHVTFSKS